MAKLSFDYAKLIAHPRFKALAKHFGGDENRALGSILRFWHVAQEYWGDGRRLVPNKIFYLDEDFPVLIEVDFAECRKDDGVYAKGAENYFEWFAAKRDAAAKGGLASAAARKAKIGSAQPQNPEADPKQTPKHSRSTPEADSKQVEALPEPSSNPSVSISASTSKREHKPPRVRTLIWEPDDPLGRVFEHLTAIPAYQAVFDREHDREAVLRHMTTYGLSLAEMERVALELRNYCDGFSEKIKSPRGKLSTFVQNFAAKRPAKTSAPAMNFVTLEQLKAMDQ